MSAAFDWRTFGFRMEARFGITGLLGFGLIAAALFVLLFSDARAFSENQHLRREIVALKQANPDAALPKVLAELPAPDASWPGIDELSGVLADVFQQATDHQVLVAGADYVFTPARTAALAEYEITFNIKGSYVPIRELTQSILNSEPSVALRELSFSRDGPNRADLTTRLRLVVFVSGNASNGQGAR